MGDAGAGGAPGWYADPWHRDSGQLRFHDGRQWTGHVRDRAQLPAPPMAPWIQPASDYPLGAPELVLHAEPVGADIDMACTVLNPAGHLLASIRSRGRGPNVLAREVEDLTFVVLGPNGAERLLISRRAGLFKQHRVHVHDAAHNYLGTLRQTSSSWRGFVTPRRSVTVEFGDQSLASTEVCIEPEKLRFANIQQPIHDATGAVIATVHRTWRYVDTISEFFDYRLACHRPVPHPLPELLLATAFTHYLYDRLAVGGPLKAMNGFGRGGTWYDARSREYNEENRS
ncbi:MAG: DUF2510 domain-containing protein [Actinomycetota bacterium]|nr:DUF2510 domain-containing protein [Actinomycetota bacterium]